MPRTKLVTTGSGERVPSGNYVWITTTTDIDEIYPDEKGGPGGWFPFAVVDLKPPANDPIPMNSCVVLWRSAISEKQLEKKREQQEEEPEDFPTIMTRVEIYADARDISTEEALDELLSFAMDDVGNEEMKEAYHMAGFTRKF